jgi:1,2-diacylglycerol 3-beta-glucosyltransferase
MPKVTVLIPARNEEFTISRKIQNIAELDYDRDKIDLIVVDDDSDDQTCRLAAYAIKRFGLQGTIAKNSRRSGTNASYNTGIQKAKGDMILLTDADVTIEKDSLKKAVTIMTNIKSVGAITARMIPVSDEEKGATALEHTYISFMDNVYTAESGIYSTFPGFGGFLLLRKEALSPIPVDYGSKDGNIAFSTLKKGFRYICVPHIVFYEKISKRFKDQIKQKARRSARLIQSVLLNRDIAFKKEFRQFGKLIFPLRFAMLVICPILVFIASFSALLSMLYLSTALALLFLSAFFFFLLLGTRASNPILRFLSSFAFHQSYLALGLILSPKKMRVWN